MYILVTNGIWAVILIYDNAFFFKFYRIRRRIQPKSTSSKFGTKKNFVNWLVENLISALTTLLAPRCRYTYLHSDAYRDSATAIVPVLAQYSIIF